MSGCHTTTVPDNQETLVHVVNEAYSKKGREGADQAYAERVANVSGYSSEELRSVPAEAHMGLSCGNPIALAAIKEGETVLDLGSGGGMDVFLAAARVGHSGHVIGLDNSDDMIARARRNASAKGLKPPHVAFVKAALNSDLPIESNSVDCVLSNCVLNLLPPEGKCKVLQEVHRILKPGGRVSIDDIIARKTFPYSLRSNMALYVACISGAILLQEYKALMEDAGFKDVLFTENPSDLNVYGLTGCCVPSAPSDSGNLKDNNSIGHAGTYASADIGDLNEWAGSYHIYAVKSDGSAAADPVPTSALKDWWDAYPTPTSSPGHLECEEVVDLIRNPGISKKDFVVIDVRRNDHTGGHVRGSVQKPAQTFYDELPEFYEEHKETKQVIFYCGSSNGRGPRCAKWYQDYLDQQGNANSKAFVMAGGVRKWLSSYDRHDDLVDFD